MGYEVFSDGKYSPLTINTLGFGSDTEVTKFGPGQRDLYIIHYVTAGRGYYNGNPVTEGQGFLIFPGQHEEYHADDSNPWEFLWVISSDNAMKEIFYRYNADCETLIFDYHSVATAIEIGNEIILKNNSILDSLKIAEMFLHILNSHSHRQSPLQRKRNSDIYLDFCVNYTKANIHKKITVEELSRLTGVSQPYLYKLFMDRFGMSTKQYITLQKMSRAKELLTQSHMSITEIAKSIGYDDVLAFSKAFGSKQKMSPQEFRRFAQSGLM